MKKGWQSKRLGEVCDVLKRGVSPKYLEAGGICVLNQKCIRNHAVSFEPSRRHDISIKKVPNERFVQLGDVLVNSTGTGTLGRIAQIRELPTEQTTVDSHVTIVRPNKSLFHLDFFGYAMIMIEEEIKKAGEGCGGQTELARTTLAEKFFVRFPKSFEEQRRLVSILEKSFKAIAIAKTNTKKNLQNARALFEGHLNDIFSRQCVGWSSAFLKDVLIQQPRNGWSPPAANHSSSGTPVLTLSSVTGFTFRKEKIKHTNCQTDSSRHYWVENGDFLMTRSNTPELVGHVAIASGITEPTIYPDLIMRMKVAKKLMLPEFLYYQMRSPSMRFEITGRAKGANPTMKKLNKESVTSLPIVFPPLKKQEEIVTKIKSLSYETQRLESIYQKKFAALEELKKSLLYQAFNGGL